MVFAQMELLWYYFWERSDKVAKCYICGKSPQFGHNVSHALNRTKRQFKPNIQRRTITIGSTKRRIYLCNRCWRSWDKMIANGKLKF